MIHRNEKRKDQIWCALKYTVILSKIERLALLYEIVSLLDTSCLYYSTTQSKNHDISQAYLIVHIWAFQSQLFDICNFKRCWNKCNFLQHPPVAEYCISEYRHSDLLYDFLYYSRYRSSKTLFELFYVIRDRQRKKSKCNVHIIPMRSCRNQSMII